MIGNEENIVKKVCKELNITQKELSEKIGISENTIGGWARGITETPKWALNHFELLKIEKKYNAAKHLFCDLEKQKS